VKKMAELSVGYYVCRLCGYIHKGKENPNVCPACGAPATSFIPYKMGAEEKRVNILKLDIHPILTHFTVSLSAILVIILIINYINPNMGGINFGFGGVLDFIAITLPIAAVLTGIAGVIDGKLRYKKLKTPYLRRKIILGISMVLATILVMVFHLTSQDGNIVWLFVFESIFAFISVGLSLFLGMIGTELKCNIVPRGRELPKEKN
jgi:uncharacterized membrane protein